MGSESFESVPRELFCPLFTMQGYKEEVSAMNQKETLIETVVHASSHQSYEKLLLLISRPTMILCHLA